MFRQFQSWLTYAVLALYAATTLPGHGLHLLVCADHHHDHTAEPNQSAAGQQAGGGHGEAAETGLAAGDGRLASIPAGHAAGRQQIAGGPTHGQHGADCPICLFHSQGQIVAPNVEPGVAPLIGGDAVYPAPPADCRVRVAAYGARAPPRG